MDGVFVPNISFGFPVLKAIAKYAKKPLDVHLMIVNPDQYVQSFKDAGAEILTVHAFAQKCLGQEPPDHASKWLRTDTGRILFDLWHAEQYEEAA